MHTAKVRRAIKIVAVRRRWHRGVEAVSLVFEAVENLFSIGASLTNQRAPVFQACSKSNQRMTISRLMGSVNRRPPDFFEEIAVSCARPMVRDDRRRPERPKPKSKVAMWYKDVVLRWLALAYPRL